MILNDLRVSQVPIDIKYKRYEQGKVPTNDIYQTFLYAYALGSHDDRRAGIVYPSTDVPRTTALSVHAVDGEVGAHIAAAGIDVPAMLQALYGSKSEQSLALQQVRAVVLGLCAFAFDRAVR